MPDNADTETVIWADENGDFILSDGDFGNPGCDECGQDDAVVKVGGTYLCLAAATARGLQHKNGSDER